MARYPSFVGGSYESQSRMVAGERCVNWYPALVETSGAKAQMALYPCPGLPDFATMPDSPGRGIFTEDTGRLFAVFGGSLCEITVAANGTVTVTPRGAVAIDVNPATFATNGDGELMVTSGTIGYLLTLATNALTTEVTGVTMCGHLDTFLLGLDAVTGTLKISEASDGTTWDPTQVVQRSAAPDPWVAMLVSRREIFLFGGKTGEVWYNAGTSPFPFRQRAGAFFEIGIEAPASLAPFGSTMAWLGRSERGSGKVYWMNGYTPNPISNEAVEWAIQQYKDANTIADAIGWSYDRLGHSFYVLEFPTAGKTWVYDATTNLWHERGRWSSIENNFVAYRPRFHAEAFRKNLVCDSQSAKIYSLSETIYTDVGGQELRRVRRLPHLSNEHKRFFLDSFEVEAERGVGLVAGQGSDPQLMLRTSWDGGQTWGNERWRSLGKKGEYSQRIKWDRCGSGRDLVIELACSDPVKVALFDAYMEVS